MNRQTFLRYLEQPRLLTELPLSELQALALEYPYSTNIRMLLLLKAKQEDHVDTEAYLHRCAAATFDRAHLFDLLREMEKAGIERPGEVLELLELDELELEATETGAGEALPSRLNEMYAEQEPAEPAISLPPPPVAELAPRPTPSPVRTPVSSPVLSSPVYRDWAESASAFLSAMPNGAGEPYDFSAVLPQRPEDPEKFRNIVAKQPATNLSDRLRKLRQLRQPEAPENPELDRIVHRSVVDHGAVASETLAALLVRQEQYQNAIKMYRRLILLYPEKEPIFAALIKELTEKL